MPLLRSGWRRASVIRGDVAVIIFNAELQQKNGNPLLFIRNEAERLLVDNIKLKGDSVYIELPFFESYFRLQIQSDGSLKRKWLKAGGVKLLQFLVTFECQQKGGLLKQQMQQAVGR